MTNGGFVHHFATRTQSWALREKQLTTPTLTDWISALSSLLGALAVTAGLLTAWLTYRANRRSARDLRRAQVAEDLIAVAFKIEDAFRYIRNPADRVPQEKVNDANYQLQMRYERITKYNELFNELRDAHIHVRAVIGKVNSQQIDAAVDDLFLIRSEISTAIEMLVDHAEIPPNDAEERQNWVSWRRVAFGDFCPGDQLGERILKKVGVIEDTLSEFTPQD